MISWTPNGASFTIRDKKGLEEQVIPLYFQNRVYFRSFLRKLYRWGFAKCFSKSSGDSRRKRFVGQGLTYFHKAFRRDRPDLCHAISCSGPDSSGGKTTGLTSITKNHSRTNFIAPAVSRTSDPTDGYLLPSPSSMLPNSESSVFTRRSSISGGAGDIVNTTVHASLPQGRSTVPARAGNPPVTSTNNHLNVQDPNDGQVASLLSAMRRVPPRGSVDPFFTPREFYYPRQAYYGRNIMLPLYLQDIVRVSDDERRAQLTHTRQNSTAPLISHHQQERVQVQEAFDYGQRVQVQEEFEYGQRQVTMIDQLLNTLNGRARTHVEGNTAMRARTQVEGNTATQHRYQQMFH